MSKEERDAKIYYDNWKNARELHLLHPDTFHWEVFDIAIGDTIKISNNIERFWCRIIELKSSGKMLTS